MITQPRQPTYLILVCLFLASAALGSSLLRGPEQAIGQSDAPGPREQAEGLSAAFRIAAKRVRPSVLNITTERWIDQNKNNPFVNFLGRLLEGRRREKEGRTQLERSFGTGFVVRSDGLALTNNHVVAKAKRVLVRLHDGTEVKAKVIGTDPLSDLAVLQLEPRPDGKPYIPVEFGDSDALEVGDWVLAIGNPFGLDQTVTAGIVSAKGRSRVGIAAYEDFIQTDAAINPGNSGGPLLDLDGKVVGVTTAIASRSGAYQGVGFAIPTAMARKVMEDVVDHGRVVRAWLGVSVQDASPKLARRLGLGERGGGLVGGAFPGGPAAEAGVRAGDLIVAVGSERVDNVTRLLHLIAAAEVGKPLTLRIVREGGQEHSVTVVPIERKPAEEDEPEEVEVPPPPGVGITARELNPRLAGYLGFEKDAKGVVIVRVEHGSLAAEQGIRPGMILQEVDRKAIHTLEDLDAAKEAIDLDKGVLLRVWDGNISRFILLD